MKKGQILIAKHNYLDCFKAKEEYLIDRVEDCLGDLMAMVKDSNGKTVTWALKQFEIDINFEVKS